MEVKELPDWESFVTEVKTLQEKYSDPSYPLLFRGQPDSEFGLTTTLERAVGKDMTFDAYYRLASRTRPAVETFTRVKWEVPEYSVGLEKSFLDINFFADIPFRFPSIELYRYLVYLRHHGFPSPLLDWSKSPYVAAFFAFKDLASRPNSGKPEKRSIYVYCEMPRHSKGWAVGEPAMRPIGSFIRSHHRHFRQQSDYTMCWAFEANVGWKFYPHELVFGGRNDNQDALWKINLPSTEWRAVLRLMNDYNLNAYSLFDSEEALLETMWFQQHVMRVTE